MINNINNILKKSELALINSNIYSGDHAHQSAATNAVLEAKLDASILLSHVLAKPRLYLHTWPEQVLTIGQCAMFWALIERRCVGEPIAYIIEQKEFFSLVFLVNHHTLIPRPETELLVELILERFKHHQQDLKILDLGTGSGAIAISLAKTRTNWQVTAVDNSESALKVARQNAALNNTANVEFILSDWFSQVDNGMKFDCIVANPPYITDNNPHLIQGDLKFEPKAALLSPNNGLLDLEKIVKLAKNYLNPKGLLILEHGYDQRAQISAMLSSIPEYSQIEVFDDYSGLPRIIAAVHI